MGGQSVVQAALDRPQASVAQAVDPDRAGAGPSIFQALKPVVEVAALFSALAFVTGWSHLTSYYYAFGLNPLELDLPVSFASALSLQVLYRSVWPAAVLIVAAVAFVIVGRRFRLAPVSLEKWVPPALLVLLAICAVAGSQNGSELAHRDLLDRTSTLPSAGFVTDLTGDLPDCTVKGTTDCRLLGHFKGVYYVLQPIYSQTDVPSQNFDLYAIPDAHIRSAHIMRGFK